MPTITGDVRNYLRDSGLMRMPRDMRQRLYQMTQEQERFEREHLRTPTAVELSERMGIAPEEFLALLALRTQNEAVSLDTPVGEEGDTQLSDLLGSTDDRFERMERSEWAQWLLSKVGDTERELLTLRYRDGLGQRETARRLGISQMQVSWLERRSAACRPWRPRHNEAWNVKGGWRVCNRTPINRRILSAGTVRPRELAAAQRHAAAGPSRHGGTGLAGRPPGRRASQVRIRDMAISSRSPCIRWNSCNRCTRRSSFSRCLRRSSFSNAI